MSSRQEELDRQLGDYLGLKKKEREEGNTNEAIRKALATLTTGLQDHAAEDARRFDRVDKILDSHHLRLTSLESQSVVKSIPLGQGESIPPPLTLGDKTDWKRTPMGGIKLDQKDQAVLATRMAKLEEERRIADAVARERADIIASQKKEAEEKRLEAEQKEAQAKKDKREQDALDIQKSGERRARLTTYVAAGVALGTMIGSGIVWLVQALTHH
jgi:hypothetical protein